MSTHLRLPPPDPRAFAAAQPCPHVVVPAALITPPDKILADFPSADWTGWKRYEDEYQPGKRICSDSERFTGVVAELVAEMQGPTFLQWLEELTGIDKLIPDPYLAGGGLHSSGPGGNLVPHTDFHLYTRLDLFRRLNALLYLNVDWTEADGGHLGFYDGDGNVVRQVLPAWGTLVVFRTDDDSVHGFTTPVAEDKERRSIALYYYTSAETGHFSGDHNTYWRTHGEPRGVARARLGLYKGLILGSRGFSFLANRVNPNLGRKPGAR